MNELPPPVALVGAGSAGVSCALWLQTLEVSFDWFDRDGRVGGTLHRVHHPLKNLPGNEAPHGAAFAARLAREVESRGLRLHKAEVRALDPAHGTLTLDDDAPRQYHYIVLATGTRPRQLQIPGLSALKKEQRFLSSHQARADIQGRRALIVGGGDGAFEGALILREGDAAEVSILCRSTKARARPSFQQRVAQDPGISLHFEEELLEISASPNQVQARLRSGRILATDLLVTKIGVEPTLPLLESPLERWPGGYLKVDASGKSSAPCVYAAGDLCSPFFQSVSTANGQGAQAAAAIARALSRQPALAMKRRTDAGGVNVSGGR